MLRQKRNMKKILLVLALVATLSLPASAISPRPYWFHDSSHNWFTTFYVQNVDTTARTATVTFYGAAQGGMLLGSTAMSIAPNGIWRFDTSMVPDIVILEQDEGTVVITGSAATTITGYTSIANTSLFSGYLPRLTPSNAGSTTVFTQE